MFSSENNRHTTEMGVEDLSPMIERSGLETAPGQFTRELWMNARQSGAENILISPCWPFVEACVKAGVMPIYRYQIADDGCGMTDREILKYINKLSSSGHPLKVSGGNHGLGAKVSTLYWNQAGVLILSWKDGVGRMAKLWKDPRPNVKTFGRYGLAPVELDDGSFSEFSEAPEEYKPSFITDHGTVIILCGNKETEDTWQGPIGHDGDHTLAKIYSHLTALNTRFFRVPGNLNTTIHYMKEKKVDWPLSEKEAHDRARDSERKGWTRSMAGMEPQLLADSIEYGTVAHPEFKVHWYRLNPDRPSVPYFVQDGFVASMYESEIYDLHRQRAASSYMSMFGVYRRQIQQNLVLIVEPDPKYLMTDNTRTRLIDSRIGERHTTEKLPWAVYGDFFKSVMPENIRKDLENISLGATNQELTKVIDLEIQKYAPWMSRPGRARSPSVRTNTSEPKKKEQGEEKKPKPRPKKPRDNTSIVNGLLSTPQIQWLNEGDDEDIKGHVGRYDIANNILLLNNDFILFKEEPLRRLQEYDLSGDIEAEKTLVEATRRTYAEKVATSIVHLHKYKDTEHWTAEKWEQAVSPHSLTFSVLGMKWAESGIKHLSGPEISTKKKTAEATKKATKAASRRGKKTAESIISEVATKARIKQAKAK